MLGLEKRVESMRQMYGDTPGQESTERSSPAKSAANMGVLLALVAIIGALLAYFVLDAKYSAKLAAYDARMAAMDARVMEAVNAPREMAKRVITANTLTEVTHKVDQLKGTMDAAYQERLAKIDEMVKALQQEMK